MVAEYSHCSDAYRCIADTAKEKHPRLFDVIERNGEISLKSTRDGDLVEFLAGTVVSQQLATRAAQSIWSRIVGLAGLRDESLCETLDGRCTNEVLACGLSHSKEKAIRRMLKSVKNGDLSESHIRTASYEEVTELITSLWGFGPWSADMVAMFYVKQPDVWPRSDVALIRGLRELVPDEDTEAVAAQYSPYRTYLARHVWRALDLGLITE